MAPDVQKWVRESESVTLPVEVIAKRTALMAHEIERLGDLSLSDLPTRPIGIDYAILILPNDLNATLTPKGEAFLSAAYAYCKNLLKPYLVEVSVEDIEWGDIFSPFSATDWFDSVAMLWRDNCEFSLIGNAETMSGPAIEIAVTGSQGDPEEIILMQVLFDSANDKWVLAVLDPTRAQRRWLRERNWEEKGTTQWQSFSNLPSLATAIVNALDALAQPNDDASSLEVTVMRLADLEDTQEWEDLISTRANLSLFGGEEISASIWPGSDLELLSTHLFSSEVDDAREACNIYGELVVPVVVEIEYSTIKEIRSAGFSVVEIGDEEDYEDDDVPCLVTIYPKSTRVMVV